MLKRTNNRTCLEQMNVWTTRVIARQRHGKPRSNTTLQSPTEQRLGYLQRSPQCSSWPPSTPLECCNAAGTSSSCSRCPTSPSNWGQPRCRSGRATIRSSTAWPETDLLWVHGKTDGTVVSMLASDRKVMGSFLISTTLAFNWYIFVKSTYHLVLMAITSFFSIGK